MNKKELVKKVADLAHASESSVDKVLGALVRTLTTELQAGEKLTLPSFGSFEVVAKAARKGLNPATKKEIVIPAKNVVKFKAAKALKDAV